ncbi:hypothetical protein P152DRAFT_316046 [Eremomyces bilateralis CBS 781.70]|uniref:Uncharacterized protein n=1 Tax=Eremomyces bilateralis CBS 781.70 TaxID=1392243 RepID=A0A6G1G5M4_9PEZI|nr:uncharacterized protein P152DRAFT_316046 [Eremomyces bilateralis CBS 781.70]KAF1813367.1 hypothetical protein P152DRAFT_316046 [Eremomyces bilateralis CBS 781.70]
MAVRLSAVVIRARRARYASETGTGFGDPVYLRWSIVNNRSQWISMNLQLRCRTIQEPHSILMAHGAEFLPCAPPPYSTALCRIELFLDKINHTCLCTSLGCRYSKFLHIIWHPQSVSAGQSILNTVITLTHPRKPSFPTTIFLHVAPVCRRRSLGSAARLAI